MTKSHVVLVFSSDLLVVLCSSFLNQSFSIVNQNQLKAIPDYFQHSNENRSNWAQCVSLCRSISYALSEWEQNAMQPSMRKRHLEAKLHTSITRCSKINIPHVGCNISNTRDSVSLGYPNTEKRVENTTHSRVEFFLMKFEVFG